MAVIRKFEPNDKFGFKYGFLTLTSDFSIYCEVFEHLLEEEETSVFRSAFGVATLFF